MVCFPFIQARRHEEYAGPSSAKYSPPRLPVSMRACGRLPVWCTFLVVVALYILLYRGCVSRLMALRFASVCIDFSCSKHKCLKRCTYHQNTSPYLCLIGYRISFAGYPRIFVCLFSAQLKLRMHLCRKTSYGGYAQTFWIRSYNARADFRNRVLTVWTKHFICFAQTGQFPM